MKRISTVIQEYGADREVELCQLDGDPAQTVAGLKAKTLTVGKLGARRRTKIPKYTNVRVVDNNGAA